MKTTLKYIFYPIVIIRRNYLSYRFRRIVHANPKKAIDIIWKKEKHYTIDWENPRDLNEKITWLMVKTDISLWVQLADKYLVKSFLKECGLEEYVPKLLGVWSGVDQIDLANLPQKFVLKCNHDCGSTHIIDKNTSFDFSYIKSDLQKHLHTPYGLDSVEIHYLRIKPCVIAEEYLENACSDISTSIVDYKFWCFDGKPYFCFVCLDRYLEHLTFDMYDVINWEPVHEYLSEDRSDNKKVPRPTNLDLMLKIVTKLAKGFPQVRIDLYEVKGKVYFGEMTFTSAGGRMSYFNEKGLQEMGKLVTLPQLKSEFKNN